MRTPVPLNDVTRGMILDHAVFRQPRLQSEHKPPDYGRSRARLSKCLDMYGSSLAHAHNGSDLHAVHFCRSESRRSHDKNDSLGLIGACDFDTRTRHVASVVRRERQVDPRPFIRSSGPPRPSIDAKVLDFLRWHSPRYRQGSKSTPRAACSGQRAGETICDPISARYLSD